jgi:transcriptional regulator with XRE-family HTH domain
MDSIAERIREIIDFTGLSNKDFADSIDVAPAIISHILSGRNKPSLHIIQQITNVYTNVNLTYLLNGDGSLINSSSTPKQGLSAYDDGIRTVSAPTGAPLPKREPISPKPDINKEEEKSKSHEKQELTNVYTNVNFKTKREIERVIIFYSDKSMEEYKP